MQLTEQHIIRTDEWRDWCIKAKNLYNQSLYYWRQSVFGNIQHFREYELIKLFRAHKEESYTSKCSAMDLEPICKHETYVGRRVKRGLFRTANGTKINADCNGAANILRKVIGDFEIKDSIWSAVIAPVKMRNFEQKLANEQMFNYEN